MATLYERINSPEIIKKLVSKLYQNALSEPELRPFFEDLLDSPTGIIDLEKKQKDFLTYVLKEEDTSEFDLRRAHSRLVDHGLNDGHFDLILMQLQKAMKDLSVPESLQEEILEKVEGTRDQVLSR